MMIIYIIKILNYFFNPNFSKKIHTELDNRIEKKIVLVLKKQNFSWFKKKKIFLNFISNKTTFSK